ncbi:MAG: M24 family metallopeptidase [Planctomycetota bacterium]
MIHPESFQHSPALTRSHRDWQPEQLAMAAQITAGFADRNANLFRGLSIPLGDPAAWIRIPSRGDVEARSIAIVRDLEMDRVRGVADVDVVHCPADFENHARSFSSDRETAVMQSLAACLLDHDIKVVRADRSLPLIAIVQLIEAGVDVVYDEELGVTDRRVKSDDEQDRLRHAQRVTEEVMKQVCEYIASATANADGVLHHDGQAISSESVRSIAAVEFLARGFSMTHGAIIAGPPHAGDCHHAGTGSLHTGVPIIVDLFPRDDTSRYHGDCTRTVVHGDVPDVIAEMHAAVVEAKKAAEAVLIPGRTAESVHHAARDVLIRSGYTEHRGTITNEPSIQHGLGHGIGLEIHEPILLDDGGGEILPGEVFTIEPGLYGRDTGGVRVEDMLVATDAGGLNFNCLPTGLTW